MWFRIEGNPSWLLEMFTAVNRKTNGRNKKTPNTNIQPENIRALSDQT